MILYRVDNRKFKVGDVIVPNTSFEETMREEKKDMEDMLNQSRPENIPEREKCLFLFQDLICALRFYSKYGGSIYGVTTNGSNCFFKGDMNKLDNILDVFRFSDDRDLRIAAVNEYWKNGTHTFNPCYEILVSSAQVEVVLCDETLMTNVKKEIETCGGSIEHTHTYRSFIKKLEPLLKNA